MNHIETLLIDEEPDQVGPLTSLPSKKRRLNGRITRADAPSHSQVTSPEICRQCEAGPYRSLASEHHHEAALTRLSQLNSPVRDVTSPGSSFGSGSGLSLASAGSGKVGKLIIDLRKPRHVADPLSSSLKSGTESYYATIRSRKTGSSEARKLTTAAMHPNFCNWLRLSRHGIRSIMPGVLSCNAKLQLWSTWRWYRARRRYIRQRWHKIRRAD
jgi:hypothetical protein